MPQRARAGWSLVIGASLVLGYWSLVLPPNGGMVLGVLDMRTVELTIDDVAFGGKGVGRDGGKAVFVPFTIEDETVVAEIVREKKQFAEAELVEIRKTSPMRVGPECPYFGRCGGCAYQHIDYAHQLGIKWRQLRDILQRIGKVTEPPMRPIMPSPVAYGYRNRITVHVRDGVTGFFRRDSNRLLDIEQCPISSAEVNQKLRDLRVSKPRDGHYTLRARWIGFSEDDANNFAASPPDLPTVRAGRALSENAFHHFVQTNNAVAEKLRELVVSLVPPNQDLLIDAYCGAGFFAKSLLDKTERVIGIDWDRFAIEEAERDATEKETYVAGNVEEELTRSGVQSGIGGSPMISKTSASGRCHKTIIIDPPPAGLTKRICETIMELSPGTLIYVSCNPATLARDLREFTRDFTIESVTPLDMFPQTAEIEVVVKLENREK